MDTQSSGSINYWPGFVDAFSNLVLALVFVIVLLAMSLGMFSGLMAKMAIQRALIEQQIKDANVGIGKDKNKGEDMPLAVTPDGEAQHTTGKEAAPVAIAPPAAERERAAGQALKQAEDDDADEADETDEAQADEVDLTAKKQRLVKVPDAPAPTDPNPAALRHENNALRQEIAALRKQNATLTQAASDSGNAKNRSGVTSAPSAESPALAPTPAPDNKFEPMMPDHDKFFNQRIESDLQRTLKEFNTQIQDGGSAHINVVIYVPNYALTENKRTALFYLISIKDYLMKRKVSPDQIRMHMAPLSPGQQEMTVSMSIEP